MLTWRHRYWWRMWMTSSMVARKRHLMNSFYFEKETDIKIRIETKAQNCGQIVQEADMDIRLIGIIVRKWTLEIQNMKPTQIQITWCQLVNPTTHRTMSGKSTDRANGNIEKNKMLRTERTPNMIGLYSWRKKNPPETIREISKVMKRWISWSYWTGTLQEILTKVNH